MPTLQENLRAELQAITFPLRRKARYRLNALANDALTTLSRPARFEENIAEQWRRILAHSAEVISTLPEPGSTRVLFGSMFGQNWITRPVEAMFAMALRMRGATPIILACDESLPACEWNTLGNGSLDAGEFGNGLWKNASQHACATCVIKLNEAYTLPGLTRRSLHDYLRPGDVERAHALAAPVRLAEVRDYFHGDVNVGEHAHAALLRALLRGTPVDDERTRFLARRYLAAAILLKELGERAFADIRPDRFVAADGVYVLAGTLCELANKRGIHVVVHGEPYRKGTVWLSHGDCYHRTLLQAKTEEWAHLEMTEPRVRVADEYLASKHFVARDYSSYHVDSIKDADAIRAELGLDERPIVALYTNILWDAQLYYRFNVFESMLEWLFETIRFYEKRTDLQLVIRLHPGEARGAFPTNQPLLPEIDREFPRLPENVKVVKPESKVSSYSLGAMSAMALIYGARVGVELVMIGTPVVVAGEAFLRGKGFSYDPATREDYFELLARGSELPRPSDEVRALARKWYYHYFFRLMMPFPYYEKLQTINSVRLTFDSLAALLPGKSPVLDRICQGILDAKTPFEWDEFEPASSSLEDSTATARV
jgi:hypothetical protein